MDQLPSLPGPRQISVSEVLTDIVGDLILAGFIAIPFLAAGLRGDTDFVPLLNPDLWQGWLPALLMLLGLSLVHDFFKLKLGNWTRALTVANVILRLVSIGFLLALVLTQDVVNPAHFAAAAPQAAGWTVGITAGCIILVYIYSIVSSIVLARRYGRGPDSALEA